MPPPSPTVSFRPRSRNRRRVNAWGGVVGVVGTSFRGYQRFVNGPIGKRLQWVTGL
jgi:hypothetical protein